MYLGAKRRYIKLFLSFKANVLNLLSEYYPGVNNNIFVVALPCTL